jgi:opacity protein-like surface antigen
MKIIALIGAGLLAGGSITAAAPADAQPRYGWNGHGGYGYHGGWRGDRWRDGRRFRAPRYGYGYRPYRVRGRVVCRLRPSYYGPVRVCRRVWR